MLLCSYLDYCESQHNARHRWFKSYCLKIDFTYVGLLLIQMCYGILIWDQLPSLACWHPSFYIKNLPMLEKCIINYFLLSFSWMSYLYVHIVIIWKYFVCRLYQWLFVTGVHQEDALFLHITNKWCHKVKEYKLFHRVFHNLLHCYLQHNRYVVFVLFFHRKDKLRL